MVTKSQLDEMRTTHLLLRAAWHLLAAAEPKHVDLKGRGEWMETRDRWRKSVEHITGRLP